MRRALLLWAFLQGGMGLGITYDFVAPSGKAFQQGRQAIQPGKTTVGEVTLHLLRYFQSRNGLKFEATTAGVRSIHEWGTRTEVESDTRLKAWGWCFTLNGHLPETLPHKTVLTQQNTHLRWYYAFSQYDSGEWVSWCTPATEATP